jgi:hypothetical protein
LVIAVPPLEVEADRKVADDERVDADCATNVEELRTALAECFVRDAEAIGVAHHDPLPLAAEGDARCGLVVRKV